MGERIFYRRVSGATHMEFDAASSQIVFTTRVYDPRQSRHVMRTVTIDEEEWMALVKYGREAGFLDGL